MTRETPCDWGDCPYNAMYIEDCRCYCGLGVDEDGYPDEEGDFNMYNITNEKIKAAEQCLIDNGIETDEASVVLQAIGYILLDKELYPDEEEEAT